MRFIVRQSHFVEEVIEATSAVEALIKFNDMDTDDLSDEGTTKITITEE